MRATLPDVVFPSAWAAAGVGPPMQGKGTGGSESCLSCEQALCAPHCQTRRVQVLMGSCRGGPPGNTGEGSEISGRPRWVSELSTAILLPVHTLGTATGAPPIPCTAMQGC